MILQIRLKGAADGQFQNIEVPFASMEDFTASLNDGEIIVCERLRTRPAGPGRREIIDRTSIGLCRDGIDWLMAPTVDFVGEDA